ncbi:hypothetical protein A0H81_01205 [Grifola frondosa]|uniref:WHIM1 domain-containing protein n=1 Tax=Grifola frondosa TaxID=5627 RepID=A0A1C7MWK0_GRIFR|nr:hypothetical protein A0H81_01205 [Grifola frondosa]
MSDYDFRPGGSLKLKGGVAEGGIVKKKKSHKSKSKEKDKLTQDETKTLRELELLMQREEAQSPSPAGSSRNSPAPGSSDRKTAAEKRFEEVQRKRLAAKVAKLADKSHKDRVNEFNTKLEALSEHHDIPKFTPLRGKLEGLDSPMDFEEALLSREANPVMTQILSRFVLNLRPQTRNLSSDVISTTVASVIQEYFKASERTVFWDDSLRVNVDPFHQMEEGFFAAEWDLKLVELQLCHSPEVKNIIDRAWGVIHNKHKKTETSSLPPPPGDPYSQEKLQLLPLGQDRERKRYWVVDDSPRLYLSTNPWKITATFQTVASTRDEYIAILEKVKETAPPEGKAGERRTKLELAHLALFKALQDRVEVIDNELARLHRARRKIEQRNLLIAQAEIRETRTRRRTTRPDYAYLNDPETDEDQDEYMYQEQEQEDEDYDDQAEFDDLGNFRPHDPSGSSGRHPASGRRRSSRTSGGGKRAAANDEWGEWRGERRSTRLGAPTETQLDGASTKRARTEESTVSASSVDMHSKVPPPQAGSGLKIKINGAAAVKANEMVVEAVAGKKKSKYWYYAVEPIPVPSGMAAAAPEAGDFTNGANGSGLAAANGSSKGGSSETFVSNSNSDHYPSDTPYEKSMEGSLSPASNMDLDES